MLNNMKNTTHIDPKFDFENNLVTKYGTTTHINQTYKFCSEIVGEKCPNGK